MEKNLNFQKNFMWMFLWWKFRIRKFCIRTFFERAFLIRMFYYWLFLLRMFWMRPFFIGTFSDRTFFMRPFLIEEFLMGLLILYMIGRFYSGSFVKTDSKFHNKSAWIFGFNNRQNGGSWLCLEVKWSLYKYGKWFYYKRMTCYILFEVLWEFILFGLWFDEFVSFDGLYDEWDEDGVFNWFY